MFERYQQARMLFCFLRLSLHLCESFWLLHGRSLFKLLRFTCLNCFKLKLKQSHGALQSLFCAHAQTRSHGRPTQGGSQP